MMALSQVAIGLQFCLKDLGSPGLSSASKLKFKFKQVTEVKVFELEDSV